MVGGAASIEQMLKVTVIDICGSTVRLGFEADKTFAVHRHEVWERIRAENEAPLPAQVAQERKERASNRGATPSKEINASAARLPDSKPKSSNHTRCKMIMKEQISTNRNNITIAVAIVLCVVALAYS